MLHPLDKAVLRDGRNSISCGHTVPLKEVMDLLLLPNVPSTRLSNNSPMVSLHKCPVCQSPIAFVQDAEVAASETVIDTKKTHHDSSSGLGSVYFKYGKYFFHLAMDSRHSSSSVLDWYGRVPWKYFFTSSSGLAQHRIANVLGIPLEKLQIIYQGKIVYPATTERMSEHELSIRLQKLAHTKSTLVVLGTRCLPSDHKTMYRQWLTLGIGLFLIGSSIRFISPSIKWS
jgi:hypothetical protein